jgi:hypothetical protein
MGEFEAARRTEFKRSGETQLLNSGVGVADEPKRQVAFRWIGDEAQTQRLREEKTYHYVRWTFVVAMAVVIVCLIGLGLTFLH